MATGDLVNIAFETGDTTEWTSTFGTNDVTSTSPIEGTYSLLTSANIHATKDFTASDAIWVMVYFNYATFPASSTRNIGAIRYSSGELISWRVTTAGELRLQLGGSELHTTAAMSTGTLYRLELHVVQSTGVIEMWLTVDHAARGTALYSTSGNSISNDPSAIRVGGLNGSHEGTHRTDYVQVATSDILTPFGGGGDIPASLMRTQHYGPRGLTGGPF